VFGVAPEDRYVKEVPDYGHLHYGTMGAVVLALCGEADYREYFRRLVFMVLSGNADAHIKNWALVYRDGLHARLAPVYDFVATVAYRSLRPHPALRWSEPPEPTVDVGSPLASVTMDDLLTAASYTEADTAAIMEDISDFAKKVRSTWTEIEHIAPAIVRERVTDHLAKAALA
jgi:serine/threonine-protein kinase HipA